MEQKRDIHVDIYSDVDDNPVAAVLWDGPAPQPFLSLRISDEGLTKFTLLGNDDIPPNSKRNTVAYATVDFATNKDGNIQSLVVRDGDIKLAVGKDPMTREQLHALDTFRESHGRNWKQALRDRWQSGEYKDSPPNDAALLQQLRNQLGPEWLSKFKPEKPGPEAAWHAGKESRTMEDGIELATLVADELGLKLSDWKLNQNLSSPWTYAEATKSVGDENIASFKIGVSSGGVVSVNGDPFTPFKRALNVTYGAVMTSANDIVRSQAMGSVANTLMESAKGWYEIAKGSNGVLLGERLHVVDNMDRMASIRDGKLMLSPVLADLNGFSRVDAKGAAQIVAELENECPEFGPFKTVDFAEFARNRHDEIIKSLDAMRVRVYAFPNGYREQAEHMFKWLSHESLKPEFAFVDGSNGTTTYLSIPAYCVPQLKIFQQTNPARWGNATEVTAELNRAEVDALLIQQKNREAMAQLTGEQKEWIEVLHHQCDLHVGEALALNSDLQPLATAHKRLCQIALTPGLDKQQEQAFDEIERRFEARLESIPKINGAKFIHDPRGETSGVIFASGASNSLSGCYKIPLPEDACDQLPEKFWLEYAMPSLSDDARKLVDVLSQACGDIHASSLAANRLVDLASAHTMLAEQVSVTTYDQDVIDEAKDRLRSAMINEVDALNVIGRDLVDHFEDIRIAFTFDPRFSTVQVLTAEGVSNRFDGEGWSVPVESESSVDIDELLSDAEAACVQSERDERPIYGYYIDLDERGSFIADVRDKDGETVFEIRAGYELDEDSTSIFDDGFMKHKNDIDGLSDYLKELGIIPKDASVLLRSDFEASLDSDDDCSL